MIANLLDGMEHEEAARAASRQGWHTLNLRGFRHAAVEGAEHQVLLTVSIEAQADERRSVELLSAILALNRALHPDG
jgi:hypothetical protein